MKPSLRFSPLQTLIGCRSDLPAKIAELEDSSVRVHKQILGLDVTVTHTLGVDVGQTPEELVHVHLGWAGHSSTPVHCFPQSTLLAHIMSLSLLAAPWPQLLNCCKPWLLNLNACCNHMEDSGDRPGPSF